MNKIIFIIWLSFGFTVLTAQNVTVSGYVRDENGELLVGATAFNPQSNRASSTNQNGFYTLAMSIGKNDLHYSFIGYDKKKLDIIVGKDTIINISLQFNSQTLNEFEVKSSKDILTDKISTVRLTIEQIKKIPAIGGEVDIIKALALTPGVSNGTEGSAGLYVRGGTPDQNLILLDDAIVYNPNHLFGFISVFNPDAIKNVDLIKGGFPARYGGRLSSVLDITMKEGNYQKNKTELGIGLLSSRFIIEHPLIKDKLSMLISARTSYLGLFLLPSRLAYKSAKTASYINYFMYDVNAKLNYKIDNKNQIYLSFYHGRDIYEDKGKYEKDRESKLALDWGNTTLTLRHNSIISPKIFLKNIIAYSQFFYKTSDYQLRMDSASKNTFNEYINQSRLSDLTFKSACEYIPNANHYIRMGIEGTFHKFTPQYSIFNTNDSTLSSDQYREDLNAFESAVFAEDDWQIGRFKINYGWRFNIYSLSKKNYFSPEPRISILYKIRDDLSIKAAYSKMQQNIHLLTNSGIGFQNDIWVPSTANVKPQKSQQLALGLSKYFSKGNWELSIEAYKKQFNNIIDYKEGINIVTNLDGWEKAIQKNGRGYSQGIEIMLQKKEGRFNGFSSYTLSKTIRQFDSINLGNEYPFRYDNRHVFTFTGNYQLNKKWDISATWIFKSGEPITLPLYKIADDPFYYGPRNKFDGFPVYSTRNGYRLPSYHRADVAFNKTITTKKGRIRKWSFSIFNLYNRKNVLYVKVSAKFDVYDNKTKIYYSKQILVPKSLFPIIPSVSYSLSF